MSQWAPTGGRARCRVSSAAADANGADKPHLLRGATEMRHSGRRCIVDGHARQHLKAPAQEIRTSNSDPLERRTNNEIPCIPSYAPGGGRGRSAVVVVGRKCIWFRVR